MDTIIVKKSDNNRLDALLTLRGFACLLVLLCHGIFIPQLSSLRQSLIYKDYDFTWVLFSQGPVEVWIFFVLSGYLMGKAFYLGRYSANVSGTINFWRNRVLRIFPLYYFVAFIVTVFVYTDYLKLSNWGYLLRVLTFTYNPYIGGLADKHDIPCWSLSTELQFYFFVPFVYGFLSSRLKSIWSVATAGVIAIVGTFLIKSVIWIGLHSQITDVELLTMNTLKYWYVPLINNIDLFLCGFLVNPILKYSDNSNIKFSSFKLPMKILAIILLIALYLYTAHHAYYQQKVLVPTIPNRFLITSEMVFLMQPLTALITAFFIFAFEANNYNNYIKNEKLSFAAIIENPARSLEFFGILSYGIYLWHFPIMQKIKPLFNTKMPLESCLLMIIESLILSVILSVITYYLVERPFTKRKKFSE